MQPYMDMFAATMRSAARSKKYRAVCGPPPSRNSPELAAQLKTPVSSMYSHLGDGADVHEPDPPTLFRNASGYRRQLTLTPAGVIAEKTSDDPNLTEVIRAHAREVTGFVTEGNARDDGRHDGPWRHGPRPPVRGR